MGTGWAWPTIALSGAEVEWVKTDAPLPFRVFFCGLPGGVAWGVVVVPPPFTMGFFGDGEVRLIEGLFATAVPLPGDGESSEAELEVGSLE